MLKYIFAAAVLVLVWIIVLVLRLPDWVAIGATVVVIGAIGGMFGMERYRASQAARNIEKSLNAQAAEHARAVRPEQQAEIQAMQGEFSKAIGSLKSSKGNGAQALYALPWYMIIGPPGTGKSTALRNSGLQFPYLSQSGGGVRGVGGTRNCEWWLTNEGVILDTAGRYTTEDDDRDEWFAFLDMLKRNRPRKPVNGIMVAVSVGDLGGAREEDVLMMAKRIRERIDEVMGRLQVILPVYLLFTKCDLLPGFVETFGDLRKQERGQVWGFTVPLGVRVSAPGDLFAERFDELAHIIEQRMLRRLVQERRWDARDQIWVFPQQFEILRQNCADFCGTLFLENAYQGTPIMRGVYFTSGTQEGRPIDRVMNSMAAAFGINRAAGMIQQPQEPKSYFLGDVFSKVVFPDQDVAARSPEELLTERKQKFGVAAAAMFLAVLVSVLPGYAFFRNQDLLHSTESIAVALGTRRNLPAVNGVVPVGLDILEPLRERVVQLRGYEEHHAPMSMSFGMFQGGEVYPQVRDLYTSTLRRDVIGPIIRRALGDMNEFGRRYEVAMDVHPTAEEHERFHNALKIYLLLTSPHAANEASLATAQDWLTGQLAERWATMLSVTDANQRTIMAENVRSYLQLLQVHPDLAFERDQETVRRVRGALTRVPEINLALEQMISDIERDGYGMTLQSLLGTSTTAIRATGQVRGAFTRRGWEERVREHMGAMLDLIGGEAWVYGRDPARDLSARRSEQVRALRSQYFSQYIAEWRGFLDSIRVERPADPTAALPVIQELTRGEPPALGMLMRGVAYNTHLEEAPGPSVGSVMGALGAAVPQDQLARIPDAGYAGAALQRAGANAIAGAPQIDERAAVETTFRGFAGFGAPPPPQPQPAGAPPAPPATVNLNLTTYQEQLQFVRQSLEAYTENPNAGPGPLQTAQHNAQTTLDGLLQHAVSDEWRPRLQAILWPPLQFTVARASGSRGR